MSHFKHDEYLSVVVLQNNFYNCKGICNISYGRKMYKSCFFTSGCLYLVILLSYPVMDLGEFLKDILSFAELGRLISRLT